MLRTGNEKNIPVAALNLGTFYYNGLYVKQDYKKAYKYYKIAADAGEVRALCNCGYCWYYGHHAEVNYDKAYYYFSLGVLLYDDANCLYKLGDMYLNGYGVEKNEMYAFKLYIRAFDKCLYEEEDSYCIGDVWARIGKCYLKGTGTEKDILSAHKYLSMAMTELYKRSKSDTKAEGLILQNKELIAEAEQIMAKEFAKII